MSLPDTITNGSSISVSNLFRNGKTSRYIFTDHSDSAPHYLQVTVKDPKPSGNQLGIRRASLKLVKTVSASTKDGGTESAPASCELNMNWPVGSVHTTIRDLLAAMAMLITESVTWEGSGSTAIESVAVYDACRYGEI